MLEERTKKPFKWRYIERIYDELNTLIALRLKHASFCEGINLAECGDFNAARDALDLYIENHQTDWLGYYLLGELLAFHCNPIDYQQAAINFKRSQIARPAGNLNSSLRFGETLMAAQNYSDALVLLKEADELCYSTTIDVYAIIADTPSDLEIKLHKKLIDDAKIELLQMRYATSSKQPAEIVNKEILNLLSRCFIENNNLEASLWFLHRIAEVNKESKKLSFLCETIILEKKFICQPKKHIEKAYNIAKQLCEFEKLQIPSILNPVFTCLVSQTAHQGLCYGFCWYIAGLKEKNSSFLEMAIKKSPKNNTFELTSCFFLIHEGMVKECEERLIKFLSRSEQWNNHSAHALRAVALKLQGKNVPVVIHHNTRNLTLRNREEELNYRILIAKIFNGLGEYNRAATFLDEHRVDILTLSSSKVKQSFHIQEAKMYLGLHNLEKAMEAAKECFKINKSNVENNMLLGRIYLKLRAITEAKSIFIVQLFEEDAINRDVHYFVGKAAYLENPLDLSGQAKNMFDAQLNLNNFHIESRFYIAQILMKQGDYESAKDHLLQINEQVKGNLKKKHYELLNIVLWKNKSYLELTDILINWMEKEPFQSLELAYLIGQVSYFYNKDALMSSQYYSKYLEISENANGLYSEDILHRRSQAQYNIALSYLTLKRNNEALDMLNQVLITNPKMWEIHFRLATVHISLKNIQDAEDELGKGFAHNSSHATGLADRAQICLLTKEDYKKASKLAKQSIRLCDMNPQAYLVLGLAYRKQGKFQKASLVLKNAIKISNSPEVQNLAQLYLGFSLFKLGFYPLASQSLKQVKYFYKQAKHAYYRAECWARAGQQANADQFYEESTLYGTLKYYIKSIQKIFESMPYKARMPNNWIVSLEQNNQKFRLQSDQYDDTVINLLLGIAYQENGENDKKALSYFELSLAKDPKNIRCLVGKAICLFTLNRNDISVAESYVKEIQKYIPPQNYEEMTKFLILKSQIKQAINQFDQALAFATLALASAQPLLEKKNLFQRLKYEATYQIALVLLEIPDKKSEGLKILEENILHAPSLWKLGTLMSNPVEAKSLFQKAFGIDSNFTPILLSLARMPYINLTEQRYVMRYYESYFKRVEFKSIDALIEYSEIYLRNGEPKKALESVQNVFELDENCFLAWKIKGISLFDLQNYALSMEALKVAISIQKCSEVYYYMGCCEEKFTKNSCIVIVYLEESIKLDGTRINCFCEVGQQYLSMGLHDKAEAALNQCLLLEPNFERALVILGEFYMKKLNKIEQARDLIERAFIINPHNYSCMQLLVEIYQQTKEIVKLADILVICENKIDIESSILLDIAKQCIAHSSLVKFSITKSILNKVLAFQKKQKEKQMSKNILSQNNLNLKFRAILYLSVIAFQEKSFKEAQANMPKCMLLKGRASAEDKILLHYLFAQIQLTTNKPVAIAYSYLTQCLTQMKQEEKCNKIEDYLCSQPQIKLTIAASFLDSKQIFKFTQFMKKIRAIQSAESVLFSALFLIFQSKNLESKDNKLHLIKQAKTILKSAVKQYPNSEINWLTLGKIHIETGKPRKALNCFKFCESLSSTPLASLASWPLRIADILELKISISQIHEQLGEIKEAINQARQAMKEFPDELGPLERCIEALFTDNKLEESFELANKYIKLDFTRARMHWIIGKYYLSKDQSQQALVSFKRCQKQCPHFPRIYLYIARIFDSQNNNQFALEYYQKIILDSKFYDLEVVQSAIRNLTVLEQFDQAIALFEEAKLFYNQKALPLPLDITYMITLVEKRRGNSETAILMLRKILVEDPCHAEAAFTLCSTLFELKNFLQTIAVCIKFISSAGGSTQTPTSEHLVKMHTICGNSYAQLNEFKLSSEQFNHALQYETEYANIMVNIGMNSLQLNQPQCALNFFQMALMNNKIQEVPLLFIAISQARQGNVLLAIETYKKCLKLNPLFSPAAINLSTLLLRQQGNPSEAVQVLQLIAHRFPKFLTPCYHLALAQYELGDLVNSINLLQRMIENYTVYAEASISLATDTFLTAWPNSIHSSKFEDFTISYQRERLKIPRKVDLVILLSRIYRKKNRSDYELQLLDSHIKEDKSQVLAFAKAISISLSQSNRNSLPAIQKCLKKDPSRSPLYLLAIANEYNKRKRYNQELNTLLECLRINPSFIQAWDNLGVLYVTQGNRQLAAEAFQKSIDLNPRVANTHFNLANVLLQQQEIEKSIQQYIKCIEIDKNHLRAHFNLGIAYSNSKSPNIEAAIECFQQCQRIDSTNFDSYNQNLLRLHKIFALRNSKV